MAMIRQYDDTNFVTSLRAVAAMMVIAVHTGAFASLGGIGAAVTHAGKYGVEIFFVISGFSIAVTFENARNYSTFLVRRLFRIAPLYLLVISAVFLLMRAGALPLNAWLEYFGAQLDTYNWLMHATFLSCLDQTIADSIVGVEWSIPVEVFWYAALPAILLCATSDQKLRNALLISIVAVAATRGLAQLLVTPRPDLFAKWFPTTYGPFFLLGVAAYRLRMRNAGWLRDRDQRVVQVALAVFVASILVEIPGRRIVMSLAVCLLIGLFDRQRSPKLARVFEFRPLLFLGTISYSLYLTHLPVRDALIGASGVTFGPVVFAATMAATIVVSTILYLIVEKPTNDFGKLVVQSRWISETSSEPAADTPAATILLHTQDTNDAEQNTNRRAA